MRQRAGGAGSEAHAGQWRSVWCKAERDLNDSQADGIAQGHGHVRSTRGQGAGEMRRGQKNRWDVWCKAGRGMRGEE